MVKRWPTSRSLLVVVASATAFLIVAIDGMTHPPSTSYVPYHSVGIGLRPSGICPFRCPWLTLRSGHAPGKTGYPLHAGLGKGGRKGGEGKGRKASSGDSIDDLQTLASVARLLRDMNDTIQNMATKADIQNMATKADIQNMKTDMKNMTTDMKNMKTDMKNMKTDIKTLATKADIGRMNSMLGILVERYNRAKVK